MAVQTALERNAAHLRSILSSIPDAMVVFDQRGTILSFSAAAERMFGYMETDVVGRRVSTLLPEQDRRRYDGELDRHLAGDAQPGMGSGRIIVGQRRDGSEFPVELAIGEASSDGHRIFTGFIRDLTEKQLSELRLKELQSELIHVSRLSAMGTMASTLAHELNQPLTAIANYMQAGRDLIDRVDERAELLPLLREAVAESGKEALRAGKIVRRLRDFVSHGEVDKQIEDLPSMVEEASRLALIGTAERGLLAAYHLDPAATKVLVDRVQIQQVIVNLVRNAAEAMEESAVRELVITSKPDTRGMVRVSIFDSGPGIAPQVAARLFQAFSSTKEGGMGLGLSICRTIIEAHGGRIWAEARPGGGSVFHFTLMGASTEETQ
jgi:two-component system, LuxR family, sensor kinase FixL